jgi:hypothetical protein
MSDAATDTTNDVMQDLDWDNVEDMAPSMEEGESTGEENTDESGNEVIDHEENAEDKTEDVEESTESAEQTQPEAKSDETEDKAEESESTTVNIADLGEDQKIKVKVDGEEQEISIKDFKNGISGEKAIAKRFSEFDKKEKEFKAEIDSINNYVNELGNTMKNKSMIEGLYQIGELNQIPPHQIKQALIKELLPEIDRLRGMDEQSINLEYKEQELQYKEKMLESESTNSAAKQAQMELQNNIASTREAHNINESEWDGAFKYLDENLPKNEEITVDLVKEKVLFDRAGDRANTVISEFDGGKFASDTEIVRTLHEIILDNPDFEDSDLQDILTDVYGQAQKQKAENDLVDTVSKKEGKQQQKNQSKQDQPEETSYDLDWDDL